MSPRVHALVLASCLALGVTAFLPAGAVAEPAAAATLTPAATTPATLGGIAAGSPRRHGSQTTAGGSVAAAISPVDTMQMSLLEGLLWRRHGLMRHLGFRLDPDNPVNDFRQLAHTRRRMLSWHQKLGLATVVSMALTVYGGQRAINGHSSSFHKATLPFTMGLYSAAAALALASPPKLVPSRGGRDTITYHKWFALLHVSGMVLTPILSPEGSHASLRRHQIMGYTTFGAFTGGMLVVTLFP